MNKREFLAALRARLLGMPTQEIEDRLAFYSEVIDDRMEEGLSETEAVAALGSLETVVEQILADVPLTKLAKQKIKSQKRLGAWEIVLLVLGAPVWLSLLIAAFAVVLSLYVSLWSVVASFWSVFGAFAACCPGGIAAGVIFICCGHLLPGIATIGAGIFCGGLAVFSFFGCLAATKGTVLLTKKMVLGLKKCFVGREVAV